MRCKILVFLMVVLVVSLCTLTTLAQAEEQKAQLGLLIEIKVKPTKVNEHVKIIEEMVAKDTKFNLGYAYSTSYDNNFHTYFALPLDNYGDWENYLAAWNKVAEKMGLEKHQDLYKRFADTFEFYKWAFYYYRPELSINPENPRLKPGEGKFNFWDIMYVKPGKESEAEAIFKELVALGKSKNTSEQIRIYAGDIGTEQPVYMGVLSAKDSVDFFTHNRKMWEAVGEEGSLLFQKLMTLLRKRESRQVWHSPEHSYIPKEK